MSEREHLGRPGSGYSRRAFLKGSGAAAAATALATGPGLAEAAEEQKKVAGKGLHKVTLNVNGKDHQVQIENRMTLLEVLRYQLGYTAPKPVASDGSEGASTVLIDGKPASAGAMLAQQAVGKKITTTEALGGQQPDPVVTAFVHQDAMQCGFCTPGFVMAVRAFLNKNPQATEEEIRAGLNDNLCRCGTYANVIDAALEVVKGGARG